MRNPLDVGMLVIFDSVVSGVITAREEGPKHKKPRIESDGDVEMVDSQNESYRIKFLGQEMYESVSLDRSPH